MYNHFLKLRYSRISTCVLHISSLLKKSAKAAG